ncbi:hypothetical protein TcasGA2_TC012335 [Tribolium castaneum]|uniref:Uncharacterized protein n=1 Tax=Tribolium castaneum TaxID=7070 RepID=D6X1R0_TRICA|nr:hypothetical protein TcasGA2_TC012335 [Tribolium castaneum]
MMNFNSCGKKPILIDLITSPPSLFTISSRIEEKSCETRRTSSCPFPGAVFARIVFIPDLSNELRVILSGVIRKKKFEELHSKAKNMAWAPLEAANLSN